MFKPRPKQLEILKYSGGRMGISAVPGSGKTQTLSYLAANLLYNGKINDDQEILIVTLVNAAVNNFSNRISSFMSSFGLLPGIGYRVRTLHGLAHDIVRDRPDLVGLDNEFDIIDEYETRDIYTSLVENWAKYNPSFFERWSKPQYSISNNRKIEQTWIDALISIATQFIRIAKDLQISSQSLSRLASELNYEDDLLKFGIKIYDEYQQALNYRSAVDYEDLISYALLALQIEPEFLNRLRYRWPFILEDEAQDSSRLQEAILNKLVGEEGNWVRVGDPNQAIFESFTTANPEFLISFLKQPDVISKTLPNSGRSTQSIMNLANELIRWTNHDHPTTQLRKSLTTPYIEPTPKNDPQPNPPDQPDKVHFYNQPLTSTEEINIVIRSIKKWLPNNPDQTIAILVPRNTRGAKVVEVLQKEKIPYLEILQTSQSTRNIASIISSILLFLENPNASSRMMTVVEALLKIKFQLTKDQKDRITNTLKKCNLLEEFLFPTVEHDWLLRVSSQDDAPDEDTIKILTTIQNMLSRWLNSANLPIHQVVITISQELFETPAELALAHKLALLLEQTKKNHPEWLLPSLANEMTLIASSKRKLLGFSEEDTGFNPDEHKGKVIVTTYHKAKGLEWDRVHMLSVNDYDFPSAMQNDKFISERYIYINDLNLEAEANQKLSALVNKDIETLFLEPGYATQSARFEYAAERIRLFFVGITRARKELIVTWNTGDSHQARQGKAKPSIPFLALSAYWEKKNVL